MAHRACVHACRQLTDRGHSRGKEFCNSQLHYKSHRPFVSTPPVSSPTLSISLSWYVCVLLFQPNCSLLLSYNEARRNPLLVGNSADRTTNLPLLRLDDRFNLDGLVSKEGGEGKRWQRIAQFHMLTTMWPLLQS